MHLLLLLGRIRFLFLSYKEKNKNNDELFIVKKFKREFHLKMSNMQQMRVYDNFSQFSNLHTMLSASDLSQNPERSGLGGACAWTPVLCVLRYALPTSISMSGHMVKMDICVHNMSPGDSGRTRWMMWESIPLILNALCWNWSKWSVIGVTCYFL